MDILNPEEIDIYEPPNKSYKTYHTLIINLLHNHKKNQSFFKAFKNTNSGKNIYHNFSYENKLAFNNISNDGILGLIYILKTSEQNYEKMSIIFEDTFKILKLCFNLQFPNIIDL